MLTLPFSPRHALIFALCTAPLWVYAALCGSTGHDDSHITFWQAQALLDYGDLRNYNGARIEQSSSLLMTLMTALLAWITHLSIVDSGYLLNIAGAFTTLWLVWRIALRAALPMPCLPVLLTALTPYFSYWAFSGMETTLAAACVMGFIAAVWQWQKNNTFSNGVLLAITATCLAAVRPEMVLIGPLFLLVLCVLQRKTALLLFALPFFVICLWRHSYFGVWFPNPVYAKNGSLDISQWQEGWLYFTRLFRSPLSAMGVSCTLLLLLAALQKMRAQHTNTVAQLCALWVVLYGAFVVSSGGDWMKEGRFWVPLIGPLWLCLSAVLTGGKLLKVLQYGMVTLLISYTPFFIQTFNFGTPFWTHAQQRNVSGPDASFFEMASREHLRDWPALQTLQNALQILQPSSNKPLTLLSKQMGMVNYHLNLRFHGKIHVWDMAGLVDNTLRNCKVMAQDGFDRQGMRINYRKFFDRLPQAANDCGLQSPDIIYDIYGWGESTPLPDYLRTQGYTIIFNQTGRVAMQPGIDITAQEMIAVRSALLNESSKALPKLQVNFNQMLQP